MRRTRAGEWATLRPFGCAFDPEGVVVDDRLGTPFAAGDTIAERTRSNPDAQEPTPGRLVRRRHPRRAPRATFLNEVARVLAEAREVEPLLARVTQLAVPYLADVCVADLVGEAGDIRRVAVTHADPRKQPLADALKPEAPNRDEAEHPITRVLHTREPLVMHDPDGVAFTAWATSDRHRSILEQLEGKTAMIAPLVARGRVLGVMTFVRTRSGPDYDTEQLVDIEELAARVALAADNLRLIRARDDILSIVSHDLRNPLNVIAFALSSLRGRELSDEQRSAHLDRIGRASERMNKLIEDLLDANRVEAGSLVVEGAACSPEALLADVAEMMRPLADEKGVKIEREVPEGLPPVWVDRERMLQVFSNLVGNAIKFTPSGGRITLSAHDGGSSVTFRVRDTGPGIHPEDMPRIFDRFFQARRRDRRGAGLGLTIAKGIVLAHGGRLWAESTLGEGATFSVSLPVGPGRDASTCARHHLDDAAQG